MQIYSWTRLELSLTSHYHLLLFETGIFGTADAADNEDDAGRAAAAEGGRCSLGILVTAGGAAVAALEDEAGTPAMEGMGTVVAASSTSSSSSSSRGGIVESEVSGESTPSARRSSVSSSRSLPEAAIPAVAIPAAAAAPAAAFLTVVEAVEAEAVLPPEEVEVRCRSVMTSSSSHSSSPE